jgi:hypothetical protein
VFNIIDRVLGFGKVAHDQSQQYYEFLDQQKDLCVIEFRKDPQTYAKALQDVSREAHRPYHLLVREGRHGAEAVLAWHYVYIEHYVADEVLK